MQAKWIFLDFDNTLMATEQYAVPSLIARFNALYSDKLDRALTHEEFKQHFHGQARETLCRNLSHHFNIHVDYLTLYNQREWQVMEHYQKLPHGVPMAPHLLDTLALLANQSMSFALVTNNPIQRAFAAMRYADNHRGADLAKFFGTHYFEAGDIQKPHPEVYLRAIKQTRANLEHSFAVEDSVTGATAALAAGLTTFAFTGFSDKPEALKAQLLNLGCSDAFHDWQELPSLLSTTLSSLV